MSAAYGYALRKGVSGDEPNGSSEAERGSCEDSELEHRGLLRLPERESMDVGAHRRHQFLQRSLFLDPGLHERAPGFRPPRTLCDGQKTGDGEENERERDALRTTRDFMALPPNARREQFIIVSRFAAAQGADSADPQGSKFEAGSLIRYWTCVGHFIDGRH